MKKVAIVGVEGSGKTVMLAGLGWNFSKPDAHGYYFEPQDQETVRYISTQCDKLRNGEWPASTPPDAVYGLNWHLKRTQGSGVPKTVAQISCLDFAGEVYRMAFNAPLAGKKTSLKDAAKLKQRIGLADELVVLINLRDAISGTRNSVRAAETEFVLLRLLKYVLEELTGPKPRILLALSQSDAYSETIAACGGPRQALAKYLPTLMLSYGFLDVTAIHAVDKTALNGKGEVIPAKGCSPVGLRPMVDWLLEPIGSMGNWCLTCVRGLQRKCDTWRLVGLIVLIIGAIGFAWSGFDVWLENWDVEFEHHIYTYTSAPPPEPTSHWYDKVLDWFNGSRSAPQTQYCFEDFDVSIFSGGWSWGLIWFMLFTSLMIAGLLLSFVVCREERTRLSWSDKLRVPIAIGGSVFIVFCTLSIKTLCVPNEYSGWGKHIKFIKKYLSFFDSSWTCFLLIVVSLALIVFLLVSVCVSYDRHSDEHGK